MNPYQTAILLSCVGVLILALMLRAREVFDRACNRNVKDDTRELLYRIARDSEQIQRQLAQVVKNTTPVRLEVRTMTDVRARGQKPPRPLPPTPAPQSRKRPPKAR